jgi:hypothetical protein
MVTQISLLRVRWKGRPVLGGPREPEIPKQRLTICGMEPGELNVERAHWVFHGDE